MIDMATLTGAARVALGAQLPALFCAAWSWRVRWSTADGAARPAVAPALWRGYHAGIESDIADVVNTGRGGMGGAITAALFLRTSCRPG